MSEFVAREDWLAQEVAAGRVDTVALSFADRLGGWRGKRVPASDFVDRGSAELGFCDGMIVCDIQCGVIEETPFTNYSTGYPDLHVAFDVRDARPMGWRPGEAYVFGVPSDHGGVPLPVAPVVVLESVVSRLRDQGFEVSVAAELSGAFYDRNRLAAPSMPTESVKQLPWLLLDALLDSWIPAAFCSPGFYSGSFVLGIERMSPFELAQAVVVAKGAAKELARLAGCDAVFMTRRPGEVEPALLRLDVSINAGTAADVSDVSGLLGEVMPFLFPSVNAMRQPFVAPQSDGTGEASRWFVSASAEADPATALSVSLAALGAAGEGTRSSLPAVDDLADSRRALSSEWAVEWLGLPFIENSVPLFEHEASLFAGSVTDWEIMRYWHTA